MDLDPTRGSELRKTRPAVVLTADGLNRVRRTVEIVAFSTGSALRPPIVVATSFGDGEYCSVQPGASGRQAAVDKNRLTRRAGQLAAPDLRALKDRVRTALGL